MRKFVFSLIVGFFLIAVAPGTAEDSQSQLNRELLNKTFLTAQPLQLFILYTDKNLYTMAACQVSGENFIASTESIVTSGGTIDTMGYWNGMAKDATSVPAGTSIIRSLTLPTGTNVNVTDLNVKKDRVEITFDYPNRYAPKGCSEKPRLDFVFGKNFQRQYDFNRTMALIGSVLEVPPGTDARAVENADSQRSLLPNEQQVAIERREIREKQEEAERQQNEIARRPQQIEEQQLSSAYELKLKEISDLWLTLKSRKAVRTAAEASVQLETAKRLKLLITNLLAKMQAMGISQPTGDGWVAVIKDIQRAELTYRYMVDSDQADGLWKQLHDTSPIRSHWEAHRMLLAARQLETTLKDEEDASTQLDIIDSPVSNNENARAAARLQGAFLFIDKFQLADTRLSRQHQDFIDACEVYQPNEDVIRSLRKEKALSVMGAYFLGTGEYCGIGVAKDAQDGIRLLSKSSSQGNLAATLQLGLAFANQGRWDSAEHYARRYVCEYSSSPSAGRYWGLAYFGHLVKHLPINEQQSFNHLLLTGCGKTPSLSIQ